MRAGMSYFHETIWKGVPRFLRRVDTALKNIGINERVPYNAPLIQFSSWMGGDRDGKKKKKKQQQQLFLFFSPLPVLEIFVHLFIYLFSCESPRCLASSELYQRSCIYKISAPDAGNPRVTPEVTRDVCLLARMMAANMYYSQIEDLMFEVCRQAPHPSSIHRNNKKKMNE